jgi:hypothetical protein
MVATWSTPVLRLLTKIVGIVLILLGVIGLVFGDQHLLGVFNIDLVEDIIHLITGASLTYVGFRSEEAQLRLFVGLMGILSLFAGVLGFLVPNPLGLIPHHYTAADNILHLTLGVLAVFFAWIVKSPGRASAASA